jgi:hypothetical protein
MTPPARCCRLEDKVSTVPKPKREPLLADKYLATRRWKWVPKQFDGTTRDEDQAAAVNRLPQVNRWLHVTPGVTTTKSPATDARN